MVDINELEQGVLIEANDFNMPVQNLINDISVKDRDLDHDEIYKLACNVIGSLVIQSYVSVVRTRYKFEEEDIYTPIGSVDLPKKELETFLSRPDKWDEMKIFSDTEPVELCITDRGRDYLSTL